MRNLLILILVSTVLPAHSGTFSLNLKKGDRFITRISGSQTLIRDVGGQQTQVDNSTRITLSFEVVDSNKKTCTLAMQYKRIIASSRGAGWAYKYDTAPQSTASSEKGSKEMSTFYRELIGRTIVITVDRQSGTIKNMSGWDTLIRHLAGSLKQGSREARLKLAQTLISSIKSGMTGGGPDSIFLPIAGKEIRAGNQWTVKSSMSTLSGLTLTTTYKIAEILPEKVRLAINATLATASPSTPIETGTTKIQYQLSGTQTGTVTVNRNSGWIASADLRQELQGTMTMIDMGITIPIRMTGKTTIQTLRENGQSQN
ncbi:MAG: hypothetical protein GXO69_11185 [Acidobacteria bacterium]|nr:hypothetical protein [Acidobacteriota bacterium]